jgi:DNA-binding NarL/FixJ family response regulator
MPPITVLLADDHTIVRDGLRALLELASDITVVGEARQGREAVALARKFSPEVVVMDIAMPQLNGFSATRQILALLPATKILMLSAYTDEPYVHRAREAGAAGFLGKESSAQCLSGAIRTLAMGGSYFAPSAPGRIPAPVRGGTPDSSGQEPGVLSTRESEVIQLVAEGLTNKQIGSVLSISVKTAEKHRQHLMGKLRIHGIAGLTRYAIAQRIIEGAVQVSSA